MCKVHNESRETSESVEISDLVFLPVSKLISRSKRIEQEPAEALEIVRRYRQSHAK